MKGRFNAIGFPHLMEIKKKRRNGKVFDRLNNEMKVTEHIEKAGGKTLVSFEILPPLKGGGMQSIFDTLDPLMEFKPPFIDVTYHQEEFVYKKKESGYFEKASIRKRPGTVGICSAIMHRYGVDAVPHLICGGFNIVDTENALIDLNFLDVRNVLAIRGDAKKFETKFTAETNGHKYAIDLVKQIANMNKGIYLDENIENGEPTDFSIGVAGYPEKHFESPNRKEDLKYLKEKVDAGADYIVTQMFFNNDAFFDFVDRCRNIGINVPIIPGLKPLTRSYQLNSLPRIFYMDIPEELVKAVNKAKSKKAVVEAGIEWGIHQSKELIKRGVPVIHYYTMGSPIPVKRIVEGAF